MSKYEYPRLPHQEIIAVLADSQIANISYADLLHPTMDFISKLYNAILNHIELFQEDYEHLNFEDLEMLENPDHHLDSVRVIKLCNKMRELLIALDCPKKFCLSDLIKPDTDRTEIFLSAILNFCLHKEMKMNSCRPIVEELTLLDERRKELEAREIQLHAEIEEFNESVKSEIPFVQEVDSKVNELRQMIAALNNHQMSLKASRIKLKEKSKEIDEKISSAEFVLVQSAQENANLRSRIVQSPDKLQRALEEKKLVQTEAKDAERAAMQSFQEKRTLLEIYTKACKKMSKHLTQIQALQELVNSGKSVEKEVKMLKSKLNDERMSDKSLEAKVVERQGKGVQLDELKKQLEKERDMSFKEANKEVNNVKLEIEAKRKELELRKTQVEAVVAKTNDILTKIDSVKESGAAKQQELATKCEEVMQEYYRYSNSISHLLPMIEDSTS